MNNSGCDARYESDPTLASDCQTGLTCLSQAQHTAATLPLLIQVRCHYYQRDVYVIKHHLTGD